MSSNDPPNFYLSYEKLKKIAEDLRGGGDKDAEYWAWRRGDSSSDSSSEDEFQNWLAQNRCRDKEPNERNRGGKKGERRKDKIESRQPRNDVKRRGDHERRIESSEEERLEEEEETGKKFNKRKNKRDRIKESHRKEYPARYHTLWEPDQWKKSRPDKDFPLPRNRDAPKTAKGGGVLRLPGKLKRTEPQGEGVMPIGDINTKKDPPKEGDIVDFIYSSSENDDFIEDLTPSLALKSPQSVATKVLNIPGIEKKVEKCCIEASEGSSIYCKESCKKFLLDAMRKKSSLDVMYSAFTEHYSDILHLRQELACTIACAMMYELETCQEQQAESCLWKSAFYPVIQHYRGLLGTHNETIDMGRDSPHVAPRLTETMLSTLTVQLEEHIIEGIQFYNMLVLQVQKRYKVSYRQPGDSKNNRVQVLALLLLHKLLLWIGDLYRYLSQLRDTEEWGEARNYYLLAQSLAPRNPRPYHQLALLGKYAHRRLHAVYYFSISLLVRNPFTQSREMLLAELGEVRRKAKSLRIRDDERRVKKVQNGTKTVVWVLPEEQKEQDRALNIPEPDIRKRFVTYMLSTMGSLLTRINLDSIEAQFSEVFTFLTHHVKTFGLSYHETYQQLFIINMYIVQSSEEQCRAKAVLLLQTYVEVFLDVNIVTTEDGEWLCKLHSPLSLLLLLTQWQTKNTDLLTLFRPLFWNKLVTWLNALHVAINKYKKYTDFTTDSVILKEITVLRGVEVLSSLHTLTKPFYLNNLSPPQSEDLARAVLVINACESISKLVPDIDHNGSDFIFNKTEEKETTVKTEEKEECIIKDGVEKLRIKEEDESSSGDDIEILEIIRVDSEPEDHLTELRQKKEELLISLEKKKKKEQMRQEAIKEMTGTVTHITVKPKYIVPDTNCFLSHIDMVQLLSSSSYLLAIPLVVIEEIEGLCKDVEKKKLALPALELVKKMIEEKGAQMLTTQGTLMQSFTHKSEIRSRQDNDDAILSSVVALSKQTGESLKKGSTIHLTSRVVLLTGDNNLRVKAHSRNVPVETTENFMKWSRLI